MKKPLVLVVLDGFGMRTEKHGNAIAKAKLKNFNKLWKDYPHTLLDAHGVSVGLPQGQTGGSEVGHLHLGAGRIVPQELEVINKSIADGSFYKNPVLKGAVELARKNNSMLHLFGLLSDGGVHSHQNHLFALLKLCKELDFSDVAVHAVLDGRDVAPYSGHEYLKELMRRMQLLKVGKLATVVGRAYAMDRADRWDRVKKAYELFVDAKGKTVADPIAEVQHYHSNFTDEYVPPLVIRKTPIKNGDVVIDFNFRADREVELASAFTKKEFKEFKRSRVPDVHFVAFTPYSDDLKVPAAFEHPKIKNTLGEVLSKHGLKQLRIAEKEKFVHVTYFFNGDSDIVFQGEARKLIPSVDVETYDKKPAMSARKITHDVLQLAGHYDFVLVNFANPDMLGHTGKTAATVRGLEVVDDCLGQIVSKVKSLRGITVITADHGNADEMLTSNGEKMTAHTNSPVPFVIVSDEEDYDLKRGGLANVAPTVLDLMKIKAPESYEESLIRRKASKTSLRGAYHERLRHLHRHSRKFLISSVFLTYGLLAVLLYISFKLFGSISSVDLSSSAMFALLIVFTFIAVLVATVVSLRITKRASKSLAEKLKSEKVSTLQNR